MAAKYQEGSSLRLILHSAYAYVRSTEMNVVQGQVTLDHLIDFQIASLKEGVPRDIYDPKGTVVQQRVSRYDRIEQLVEDMNNVVKSVVAAGNDPVKLREIGIYEASDLDYKETI